MIILGEGADRRRERGGGREEARVEDRGEGGGKRIEERMEVTGERGG